MQRPFLSAVPICAWLFDVGPRTKFVYVVLAAVVALGNSAEGSNDVLTIGKDGHLETTHRPKQLGLSASRQIMRHDSLRDQGETADAMHPSSFVGLMDMFRSSTRQDPDEESITVNSTKDQEQTIVYEDYHELDAGPNCPLMPFIEYPTRYDKKSVLCLNEEAKTLRLNCTSGEAKDLLKEGENRLTMAYQTKSTGKVNKSEIIQRWAKVFVPKGALAEKQGPGLPTVFVLHATIPLDNSIPEDGDKFDAKAPESHFDGLFNNEENAALDDLLERVVTIVPGGYDRYRYDAPTCKEDKYTAEFNYLPNTLGRTRHSNADDIKFFSTILEWLHGVQLVDLARVWFTGHGTGGHMTFYMMTQYLHGDTKDGLQFSAAGGAASSSSFLTCLNDPRIAHGENGNWMSLTPAPFMYFQGLRDETHWCHGGGMHKHQGEHDFSIEQMAYSFAQRNNCGMTPDGHYRMKAWVFTAQNTTDHDTKVQSQYELWEFQDCQAPLVIYTFRSLDHALKTENVFMFKQKLSFFLGDWKAPKNGVDKVLKTRNGRTMCGCCKEMEGVCEYTNNCGVGGSCFNSGEYPGGTCDASSEGNNYLRDVSCPGVSEVRNRCWCSKDLLDSPVCWWVTTDDGNDNPACA